MLRVIDGQRGQERYPLELLLGDGAETPASSGSTSVPRASKPFASGSFKAPKALERARTSGRSKPSYRTRTVETWGPEIA